jgi:hypothetical protein
MERGSYSNIDDDRPRDADPYFEEDHEFLCPCSPVWRCSWPYCRSPWPEGSLDHARR